MRAEPVEITVAELGQAIDSLDSEPDALRKMVLQRISDELSAADLSLNEGELLFSETASNLLASDSCNRTEVRSLDTRITLASDTRLTLSLESLNEPISLGLELDAHIVAQGRAKQVFGFRLGSCQELGSDSFSFSASGNASLSLELVLRLNPVLLRSEQQLVLRPVITLAGELIRQDIRADVDDSLLRDLLESVLEDEIDDALNQREVDRMAEQIEQDLLAALNVRLDNGLLLVDLPDPDDEQVDRLYSLLSPEGDFSLSLGYLRTHRMELLSALILGDDEQVEDLLGGAAQCQAAGLLQAPLAHQPLYEIGENGCTATQIPLVSASAEQQLVDQINSTSWYADDACQAAVDFKAGTTVDFCQTVLDTERLGNAASFSEQLQQWTLSPGTRFDIGAVPLAGSLQPFTQRVNYKTVATDMGQCELEMRIHAPRPLPQGQTASPATLRPLIAFHGGSWQRRSSGALGLESFATALVNEGYVVFAPFYRLIGDVEGNMACNNASLEQVLEDASDAMTWVLQNGSEYGVSGKPVVFGQSAGGHLAAMLAVERAGEIASAVVLYAPLDFTDFARQLREGEIDTETGQRILEGVLGETLESLDVGSPLIQRNSLPTRVLLDAAANPPKPLPPFFMLHGQRDTVLPYQQSVRMCNALAGIALDTTVAAPSASGDLRQILQCGDAGSQLHLIAEGEHALDLCIADELCLAGSPASAALTQDSVEQMLDWINTVAETVTEDDDVPADDDAGPSDGNDDSDETETASVATGSGASPAWLLYALVLMLVVRSRESGKLVRES